MTPIAEDPYSWLKGRFPPTVRKPFGRLPSGALVMPIGDTAVTFDPIGGQGGNHASRNAARMANEAIARCGRRYDEAWMTDIFERWWNDNARFAYEFNNILLEPLTEAGRIMLMRAAQDRAFADRHFFGNFPRASGFFPYMTDPAAAATLVAEWEAR